MKKKRIRVIPSILIENNIMIKGKNFQNHKYIGDIFNAVRIYSKKNAHELIILDKSAKEKNNYFDANLLKKISSEIFMPITVGGNISTVNQAKFLINSGAEKIFLNSTIINNYELIRDISNEIGSQSVVVGVDVINNGKEYGIFYDNGKKKYEKQLTDHLYSIVSAGAGEIVLNSISREGTRKGFDINLYQKIHNKFEIPVIASGGANSFDSFLELFDQTYISAAASSSMFCLFGNNDAVLINYLNQNELTHLIDRYE